MEVASEKKVIYFWCDKCRIDVNLEATQKVRNDWMGKCWVSKCPRCEREVYRIIGQPFKDPYFRLSAKVRSDRLRYAKYLIQPDHPDFDKLYPHVKKEREEKQERVEREEKEKKSKLAEIRKRLISGSL